VGLGIIQCLSYVLKIREGQVIIAKSRFCNLKSLQLRVSAKNILNNTMSGDEFNDNLPSLVLVINPYIFSCLTMSYIKRFNVCTKHPNQNM
jgi:hypothetical protein